MGKLVRSRRERGGQVGLEYMMVFGFALMIIVPFIFYFFFYTEGPKQESEMSQALLVARRVVDNAEVTYSLGEGARTTLRVYMPEGIQGSQLTNRAVVFQVNSRGGPSDVAYPSEINLSGSLPNSSGVYYIHMETLIDYVNISYS